MSRRKRQRLEGMPDCATAKKLIDLIGRGKLSIDAAAEISRNVDTVRLLGKASFCGFP